MKLSRSETVNQETEAERRHSNYERECEARVHWMHWSDCGGGIVMIRSLYSTLLAVVPGGSLSCLCRRML